MALKAMILNSRGCSLSKNCILGILEVCFGKKKIFLYNIIGKIVCVRTKCFYFILKKYLEIYLNLFIEKVWAFLTLFFFTTKKNYKCKLKSFYIYIYIYNKKNQKLHVLINNNIFFIITKD